MQLTKGAIGNLINRYKAVLKKCHLMNTFGSLAVAGMLIMGGAGVAVAEAVKDVPLEGKINKYDSKIEVNNLMGGWLVKSAETKAAGAITLEVNGGTISEIIGGSYVQANSAFNGTLTHGTITTTIEGTTSSQFVVGGSKIANSEKANLKTGDISLTIKGGTFGVPGETANYELVMGGNYLKADLNANDISEAEAEKITVNISDGTFNTSVTGGSVAHVYNGNSGAAPKLDVTDASTSVTITGGTFYHSQSTGGGAIKLDPSIIGGGLALVADGIKAEGVSASSTISGNTLVTIAQAEGKKLIIDDKVLGGSLAQGKGAKVTVGTEGQNNTSGIVVKNVSKVGDLVGGNMAQGGTATLYGDSYVKVEAGQVEGDIMGGSYARGAGTVTTNGNTSVVFSATNFATMPQAEYIVGGDKVLGNDTATGEIKGTSSVTINNDASVTTGAVVGGSLSRATPGTATATVAKSEVTINGGKSIAGVVGGGLAENLTGVEATSTVTETSTVSINGGTVTNIVYTKRDCDSNTKASSSAAVAGAGFATGNNATASVTDSVVVIDGANTAIQGNKDTLSEENYDNQDSAKVVAGGVAVNGGSSTVTNDTRLTMTGGKVDGDLIGGGFVDSSAGTANVGGSTHITVSGGSLVDAEIIGGGSVRNANGTANVNKDTHVTVTKYANLQDKQTWVQYVFGGGKAMTNNGEQTATADVTGSTNVTIGEQGAAGEALKIEFGTVAGGGMARAQEGGGSAIATVKNAEVTVYSGILSGVAGGGIAENYGAGSAMATVTDAATLTINGGEIRGVKYSDVENSNVAVLGGGIAKDARATTTVDTANTTAAANATVGTANTTINDGKITGHVVAGGLADGSKAEANVTKANLTINGGTINGNVFAGGMADGGTATVGTANLTISGNADIKGNIHAGGYALHGGTATVENATVTFDGNSSFAEKVFGQSHTEESSTPTVKESTLAFTNYDGTFNGQVVGFDQLNVAEGSVLQLGTLSTRKASESDKAGVFNNKALTLAGAGNVEAAVVDVVTGTSLSVKDGTLTVTKSLKSDKAGAADGKEGINVSDNGVLSADNKLLVKTEGVISIADGLQQLYLGQGGTLAVTGLGSISTADMQKYHEALVAGGTGLIKYEGAAIEISTDDTTDSGNLKGDKAEATGALLAGTTVEYDGAAGSSTAIAGTGNYGAETVLISNAANGNHTVDLKGDLTLLGDGKNLITVKGNGTPKLFQVNVDSGMALNLGSAAAPSQGGNLGAKVTLGNKSSLNAVAGDYTVGDVTGGTGAVTANTGANLNTGNISVNAVTADAANIQATGGDIKANTVTLKNNGLLASKKDDTNGGNITISDQLSGQGSVVADKTLTLGANYTGAADDVLTLQAGENITAEGQNLTQAAGGKLTVEAGGTITANNITATKVAGGTITAKDITATNVAAKKLTADAVAVDGGTLDLTGTEAADASTVKSLKLTNGTQADIKGSLKLKDHTGTITVGTGDDKVGGTTLSAQHIDLAGGKLLVDPAWGLASSNVAVENLSAGGATDVDARRQKSPWGSVITCAT